MYTYYTYMYIHTQIFIIYKEKENKCEAGSFAKLTALQQYGFAHLHHSL